MGAGAGVSTQVLWDMGYRDIDAFDWSGTAWERFVVDDENGKCPPSVRFFELAISTLCSFVMSSVWRSK